MATPNAPVPGMMPGFQNIVGSGIHWNSEDRPETVRKHRWASVVAAVSDVGLPHVVVEVTIAWIASAQQLRFRA